MPSHARTQRPSHGLLVRRGAERRSVVLAAAALLLAVIFLAMRRVSDPAPGIGMLAVLPVALIALELGLAGGLAAAALATLLLASNAVGGHPDLGVLGVVTRGLVFAAVGIVSGRFSDRMRSAYAREARLLRSGLELAGSLDDDRLDATVARAAARIPGVADARVRLDGAPDAADAASLAVPISARGTVIGELAVRHRGHLGTEDRAALELLALQAGLAADNRRLLARERERAGIEAELARARDQLSELRVGLEQVLSSQEEERGRIASRLHEHLAQILAAVLMGLRMLDREAPERRAEALGDLHGQVTEVLRELRQVAGALRPVSLSQLGLRPALEALAADRGIALELGETGPLPEPVETTVYRIVQDAVDTYDDDGLLGVRVGARDGAVELSLRPPAASRQAILSAIRARARAASGDAAELGDGTIHVIVPLDAG